LSRGAQYPYESAVLIDTIVTPNDLSQLEDRIRDLDKTVTDCADLKEATKHYFENRKLVLENIGYFE
jgi:hypothetical protein